MRVGKNVLSLTLFSDLSYTSSLCMGLTYTQIKINSSDFKRSGSVLPNSKMFTGSSSLRMRFRIF